MSFTANTITPDGPHALARPYQGLLRNNNPSGNPNAAPRCGAKNRAGCPCRAPSMPNGRCRLHGGKSTGPRTPEGQARNATANTKHGNTTAPERVYGRYIRTLIKRCRLRCHARLLWPYLPPDMAARLAKGPEELRTPIHPSNLPFVQTPAPPETPDRRHPRQPGAPVRPLPRALAAERAAAQAEAASQAPWRDAIRFARATKRERLAARRAYRATRRAVRAAQRAARAQTPAADAPPPQALLPPPNVPLSDYTPLERELAARLAGLRAHATQPDQSAPQAPDSDSNLPRINPLNPEPGPTPAQNPNSTLLRINPLNPEPAAAPAQNPTSAPSRIDPQNPETGTAASPKPTSTPPRINPMNPEQAATPAPNPTSTPARINPMNPEPPQRPHPTRLSPTKAQALRSTTLSETWQPDLHSTLAQHFGHPLRSCFLPQSTPPLPSPATPPASGHDKARPQRHAPSATPPHHPHAPR